MNRNITIGIVVAIVVLVGGFLLLKGFNKPTEMAANTTVESTPASTAATGSASESSDSAMAGLVKEFTVVGSPFKFEPAILKVKKGDTVKITFKNSAGTHDFVIDELNVKTKVLKAGTEEVVEFKADKAGSFEYYCSVGNHRQMGMKGTLTVQ